MKDKVHIRNAEAVQLVRLLALQKSGRTISDMVLDALRRYRPRRRWQAWQIQTDRWRRLLRADRRGTPRSRPAA